MQRIEFDVDYGLKINAKDIEKQINEQVKDENSKIRKILEGKSKEKFEFGINVKNVIDDNGNPIDPKSLKQYTKKTEQALNTAFSEVMKQFRGKFKQELADEISGSLSESISGMFDNFTATFIAEINKMKSDIMSGISDGAIKIDMSKSVQIDNAQAVVKDIKAQGSAVVKATEKMTSDIEKANADLEAKQEKARQSRKKMPPSTEKMLEESAGKGGKGVSKERLNKSLISEQAQQYYRILEAEQEVNDFIAQIESEKAKNIKIGDKNYSIEYFSQMKDDSTKLKAEIIELLNIYNETMKKVDILELDNTKISNSLAKMVDEQEIEQTQDKLLDSSNTINKLNITIQDIVSVFKLMGKSKEDLMDLIGEDDKGFDLDNIFTTYRLSDNGTRNNIDEISNSLQQAQAQLKELKSQYKKFLNTNMLQEDVDSTVVKETSNSGVKAGIPVYPILKVESFVKKVKETLDATREEIAKHPLEISGRLNTLDLVDDVRVAMENSIFPLNIDEQDFKSQVQKIFNTLPLSLKNVSVSGVINEEDIQFKSPSQSTILPSISQINSAESADDDFDISDDDLNNFLNMPGVFDNITASLNQMGDTSENVKEQIVHDIKNVQEAYSELDYDIASQFSDGSFHNLFEDAPEQTKNIKTAYEIMIEDIVGNIDTSIHNANITVHKEVDEMLQYLNDFRKQEKDRKGNFRKTLESKQDKSFRQSLSDHKYDPYRKNADSILTGVASSQNSQKEAEVLNTILRIQTEINKAKKGQEIHLKNIAQYTELCAIKEQDLTKEQKKSKDSLSQTVNEYQTKYIKYLENEEQYLEKINELKKGTSFESSDNESILLAAIKNQVKLSDERRQNIDDVRKQYYKLVPVLQKITDLENSENGKNANELKLKKLEEYRTLVAQGIHLQPNQKQDFEELEQNENKFKEAISQANKELEIQRSLLAETKKNLSYFADKQDLSLTSLFSYVTDKSNNGKGISQAKAIKDNLERLESTQNKGRYADEIKIYEDKYQKSVQEITKIGTGKLAALKKKLETQAQIWQQLLEDVNTYSLNGVVGYNNRHLKDNRKKLGSVNTQIQDLDKKNEKGYISSGDYEYKMVSLKNEQQTLLEETKILAARRSMFAKFSQIDEEEAKRQIAIRADAAKKRVESLNDEISSETTKNQIIDKLRHNDIDNYSKYIKTKETLEKARINKRIEQQLLDQRAQELEQQGYSKDEIQEMKWDAIGGKDAKNTYYGRNNFIKNTFSSLQNVELDLNEIIRLMSRAKEIQDEINSGTLFGDELDNSKEDLAIIQTRLTKILTRSGWSSTNDIYKYRDSQGIKDSSLHFGEYDKDYFTKGTSKQSEIVQNYDNEINRLTQDNTTNNVLIERLRSSIDKTYQKNYEKNKYLKEHIDQKITDEENDLTHLQDVYDQADEMEKIVLEARIEKSKSKLRFFKNAKSRFEDPNYLQILSSRETEQSNSVKSNRRQITTLESQITLNNQVIKQLKEQRDIQEEIRKEQEPTAEELKAQKSSKSSEKKVLTQQKKDAAELTKKQIEEIDAQIVQQQAKLNTITQDAEKNIVELRAKLIEAEKIGLEASQKNDLALQDVASRKPSNNHSDLYNEYHQVSNDYNSAKGEIQDSEKLLRQVVNARIENENAYQEGLRKLLELSKQIKKNGYTSQDTDRIKELIKPNRSEEEDKESKFLEEKQSKHFNLTREILDTARKIGMSEAVALKTDEQRRQIYETIKIDTKEIKKNLTESEKSQFNQAIQWNKMSSLASSIKSNGYNIDKEQRFAVLSNKDNKTSDEEKEYYTLLQQRTKHKELSEDILALSQSIGKTELISVDINKKKQKLYETIKIDIDAINNALEESTQKVAQDVSTFYSETPNQTDVLTMKLQKLERMQELIREINSMQDKLAVNGTVEKYQLIQAYIDELKGLSQELNLPMVQTTQKRFGQGQDVKTYELLKDNMTSVNVESRYVTAELEKQKQIELDITKIHQADSYRQSGEKRLADIGYLDNQTIKSDYINKIKEDFLVKKAQFDQMFVSKGSENGSEFMDQINDSERNIVEILSKYIKELNIMIKDQTELNSIYKELGFVADSLSDNFYEAITVFNEEEKDIEKNTQKSKQNTAVGISQEYYNARQNISDIKNEIKNQEEKVNAEKEELSLLQRKKDVIIKNGELEQSQYTDKINALTEEKRQIEQTEKALKKKKEIAESSTEVQVSGDVDENIKSPVEFQTPKIEEQKVAAIAKVTEELKKEKVSAEEVNEILSSMEHTDDKVASSAIETETALNQEDTAFTQVGLSAKEASEYKNMFAEANKGVEVSAENSNLPLQQESESIDNITISAEEAQKKMYSLSQINQNIKKAKTDKTRDKWRDQAISQGYKIEEDGFAKKIEESEIKARKQVEETTQSIKEQNIISVENQNKKSPIIEMQTQAQSEIKETDALIQDQINQAVKAAQVSIAEGSFINVGGNVSIDNAQFDKLTIALGRMNDISGKLLATVTGIYSAITSGSSFAEESINQVNSSINNTIASLEKEGSIVKTITAQVPKFGESIKNIAGNVNLTEYEDLNDAMKLMQESLLKKVQRTVKDGTKEKTINMYDINSLLEKSDVKAKYYTKVDEDEVTKPFIDLTVKFKDLEGQIINTTYTYDVLAKKLSQSGSITASISTAFSDQQKDIKKTNIELDYYSSVFDKLKIKYANYKLTDFKLLDNGELEGVTENAQRVLSIIPGSTKDMVKQVLSDMSTVSTAFNNFKDNVNNGIFTQETFKTSSNELNKLIETFNAHMNDVNRNINTSMEHMSRNRLESWKNDISKLMNVPFVQDNFDVTGLNQHGLDLIDEYNKELANLISLYEELKKQGNAFSDDQINSWNKQVSLMQELRKNINGNSSKDYVNGLGTAIDGMGVSKNVFQAMTQNASYARQVLSELAKDINKTDVNVVKLSKDNTTLTYTFRDQKNNVQTCKLSVLDYGKTVRNTMVESSQHVGLFTKTFDTLKEKLLQITKYVSAYQIFYKVVNAVRSGIEIVKELDSAMTEMQKVSNDSQEALNNFAKTSHKVAQEVGSTAAIIQNSAADWMRLGYSVKEAEGLARNTAILMNVSEFQDIGTATESMVAMLQAFKTDGMDAVELSQSLIDKLNNIGNNYSISTSELAESLKRSSGTLIAANNTVDEAIALTTAGNAIIQDAESTGSALKVISMRIRGTSAKELEEAGEDTEGLVETTSKLAEKVKMLTSINGGKGVNILGDNGTYRSTYEILQDIADLWEQIGEQDKKDGQNRQAALLEALAGKTRAQSLASILQNAEMLRSVYEDVQNSEGSAQQENEKYLESINAHMQVLQAKWQELWDNTLARDQINTVIDALGGIIDVVDQIGLVWSGAIAGGALFGLNKVVKGGGRYKLINIRDKLIRNVYLKNMPPKYLFVRRRSLKFCI